MTTSEQAIREHMQIIRMWANRYARSTAGYADVDDLISIGMMSVHDAVQSYDPARGATLRTYVSRSVKFAMAQQRERAVAKSRGSRAVKLTLSIYGDEDERPIELPSGDPGPDEMLVAMERRRAVREAIGALSSKQRSVIDARFYDEATFVEMGERTGASKQAMQQCEKYALAKIRSMLEEVA